MSSKPWSPTASTPACTPLLARPDAIAGRRMKASPLVAPYERGALPNDLFCSGHVARERAGVDEEAGRRKGTLPT